MASPSLHWAVRIVASPREAQERATDAWDRIFDALPDDLSDEEIEALPDPPEQIEVDAIQALIDDVIERDSWPRERYWGGF
jgi:hypothetical protein